jgi:hypothetical protein
MRCPSVLVLGLVAYTVAATSDIIDIVLTPSARGSTIIKAVLINKDQDNGYNLFIKNTFLDEDPIDRAIVTHNSSRVKSVGLRTLHNLADLHPDMFFALEQGQIREVEFDIAQSHMVHESSTDTHEVSVEGFFHCAELNSSTLIPDARIPFASNTLRVKVDRNQAAITFDKSFSKHFERREELVPFSPYHRKRAEITNSCDIVQTRILTDSLRQCTDRAGAAALIAENGRDRYYTRYFFYDQREEVADRLGDMAGECGNWKSRKADIYCRSPFGRQCGANEAAFIVGSSEVMVMCPGFFHLPQFSSNCGNTADSQVGVIIHEMSHIAGVVFPYAVDYAYTKRACVGLPPEKAILNAASYAFFAMDIYAHC